MSLTFIVYISKLRQNSVFQTITPLQKCRKTQKLDMPSISIEQNLNNDYVEYKVFLQQIIIIYKQFNVEPKKSFNHVLKMSTLNFVMFDKTFCNAVILFSTVTLQFLSYKLEIKNQHKKW